MRVAILAAALMMARAASAQEMTQAEEDRIVSYAANVGAAAYTIGACEDHIARADVTAAVSAMMGANDARPSAAATELRGIWARMYAKGRAESAKLGWGRAECARRIEIDAAETAKARRAFEG